MQTAAKAHLQLQQHLHLSEMSPSPGPPVYFTPRASVLGTEQTSKHLGLPQHSTVSCGLQGPWGTTLHRQTGKLVKDKISSLETQ